MSFWKNLFGNKQRPPETSSAPKSPLASEDAVAFGGLALLWSAMVKAAKELAKVANVVDGKAALHEAASLLEKHDPNMAAGLRRAAESKPDDEIVPFCQSAAVHLTQSAIKLGSGMEKILGESET